MSAASGSEISVDSIRRIVKFRLWGLWEPEHVREFCEGIRIAIGKLGRGPFCVFADISQYPAQRPEINKEIQESMTQAVKAGMVKAAHVVNGAMTEMQVKRLAKEVNAPNFRFFKTEKEASAWLAEKS